MKQGVILVACGHPYYGNYANQLCRSIKVVAPGTKVVLAHGDNGAGHLYQHNNHFDQMIPIPEDMMRTNGLKDYLKVKTCLYELSPFKETIFVDADCIWTPQKPITILFEQFKDIPFTIANRGKIELEKAASSFIHWADPKAIAEKYSIKKGWLYNLASELIYFKKSKEVKKLFAEARAVFESPKIDYKPFARSLPDELAFEIAMLKTGIYPHAAPFIPFYWEHFERRRLKVSEIYQNYFAYSLGGNIVNKTCASIYKSLATNYNKQFGINGYFPAKDKKSFLPERQQI